MTIPNNEITRFWGIDNLQRWDEQTVQQTNLPESSKWFLANVGLPSKEKWTFRFDASVKDLPRLEGRPECRIIGYDYDVPICADEARAGVVVSIEDSCPNSERFVNSSVEQFGHFLTLYQEYRRIARHFTEDDLDEITGLIDNVESRMRAGDSSAFETPNNWWPTILSQMRSGLL
jgi:SUKH-4 immunity protein